MKRLAAALLLLAAATVPANATTFEEAVALYDDRNYNAAFSVVRPLAEQGNVDAQAMLASLYETGRGTERNMSQAVNWYGAAASQKHLGSMFALGMIYLDGRHSGQPDLKLAREWTERAASAGHIPAQHNLALIFAGAGGGTPDWARAVTWFRKAASKGFADSEYNLGVLYLEGRGVDKDVTRASEWFKKAALKGLPAAAMDYGVLVFRGEGVQKDEKIGAQWLLYAANTGNPIAQNRVARLYANGRGVEKNEIEAFKWHLIASARGRNDAWLDSFAESLSEGQRTEAKKRASKFRPIEPKVVIPQTN